MTALIKQHLSRGSLQMKSQADKKRSDHQFEMGDWVFLKLQPYVQSSLAPRSNQKLAFKFFDPFHILQKIGAVAYKLQLPESSTLHPVFHVSPLKKAVDSKCSVTPFIPDGLTSFQIPKQLLQQRLVTRGLRTVLQVLVKWSSLPSSLARWEDREALIQRFSSASAWGQPWVKAGAGASTADMPDGEQVAGSKSSAAGRRKSSRRVKPNVRISGPEWAEW
jgi:hypothetical protein